MELSKIIETASAAYEPAEPNILVQAANGEDVGDTLAKFIVIELRETYDLTATDAEQVAEAVRVMERAARQLSDVVGALENLG